MQLKLTKICWITSFCSQLVSSQLSPEEFSYLDDYNLGNQFMFKKRSTDSVNQKSDDGSLALPIRTPDQLQILDPMTQIYQLDD